ncbi:MAG: polysulfide reductase NrfD [Chloroflexi bacterium]|nr:polysulfide reductase NrfD [Chloroflexota bacterium]
MRAIRPIWGKTAAPAAPVAAMVGAAAAVLPVPAYPRADASGAAAGIIPTGLAARTARLEAAVLRPLTHTSRTWYVWTGFLALAVAWGLFAYTVQLRRGLAVTGMRDVVIWGLYITNFVFFIGISHAGTLISAILRVSHAEWRRPVTRMAEVITVVALMVGAAMPMVDLGRPDRIVNLLRYGQVGSPIIWDLVSITTYITGSLIYLYLPLIPDIARCRDALRGLIPTWRWKLYSVLALSWQGTPEQHRRLERGIGVMMVLIIPIAISVHTVVSWIFAMTVRGGWNSTIFGPYFVVGAIFSGIAAIITVMAIFRRVYRLEAYITEKHFRYLSYLLLVLALIYAYFTIAEYITTGYKLAEGEKHLLEALMLGEFAVPFWTFAIGGTLVPILLIALPWTRTITGMVVASVLVNIGMWLKRFVIVVPSLELPLMPYEWGVYWPSWVEISITVAAFAGFALLFTLFAKLFPIVSAWEVAEGWAVEVDQGLAAAHGGGADGAAAPVWAALGVDGHGTESGSNGNEG